MNSLAEHLRTRRLKDSNQAKRFTREALLAKIDKLDPKPDFKLEPFTHQLVSFLYCIKYNSYGLWLEMSLGKTKVAVDVFQYRKKLGQVSRLLVCVPFQSLIGTWTDELEKHGHDLKVVALDGKKMKAKREQLFFEEECDVLVVTYSGLRALVCSKVKGKLTPDATKLDALVSRFNMLVCDESTFIADHHSLNWKIMFQLAHRIPYRYPLSGSPKTPKAESFWTQFYFIDYGDTMGSKLKDYREAYCHEITNTAFTKWVIPKRNLKLVNDTMRHKSIRYTNVECRDMPPRVGGFESPHIVLAKGSKEQNIAIHGLLEEIENAWQNKEQVEAIYNRMRRITSGYQLDDDGNVIPFKNNPKLELLLERLRETGEQKSIVVTYYQPTSVLVAAALRKAKFTVAEVHGGSKMNVTQELKKFSGNHQILVGGPSICYGLNLQHCSLMQIFESPHSVNQRKQLELRIDRPGQEGRMHYVDFCLTNTVDERILRALKEGKDVLDMLVDGRKNV